MSNRLSHFPAEKTHTTPLARPSEQVDEFQLALPATHRTLDYLRKQAEQEGVQMTVAARSMRPMQQPGFGRFAVMPRDEREAKYGKPLLYFDMPREPAQTPLCVVGWGAMHLEELKDKADEMRHYGEDVEPEEPTDWNLVLRERRERQKARRAGRKTFGPLPVAR